MFILYVMTDFFWEPSLSRLLLFSRIIQNHVCICVTFKYQIRHVSAPFLRSVRLHHAIQEPTHGQLFVEYIKISKAILFALDSSKSIHRGEEISGECENKSTEERYITILCVLFVTNESI